MITRHGVEHPSQLPLLRAKAHANTCTWRTSVEERALIEWLHSTFGVNDVLRQQHILNMAVDAFIPSLSLYVELDGCYYHGLLGLERAQSRTVQLKIARDQRLVEWFKQQTVVKLFRLSDLQWWSITQLHTYDVLKEQMHAVCDVVTYFDHAPGYNLTQDPHMNQQVNPKFGSE
jgi:hypothetical protein